MSTKGKKPAGGSTYVYTARGDESLGVDDVGAKRRKGDPPPQGAKDTEPMLPRPPEPEAEVSGSTGAQAGAELPLPSAPPAAARDDSGERSLEPEPVPRSAKATVAGTPRAKGLPPPDPRVASIEKLMARGAWGEVASTLGEPDAEMPPLLRLVWAVARKEAGTGPKERSPDGIAIEATAQLLGLERDSPMALVIAKRLLRRRAWAETPAPKPWLSVTLLLLGLAVGASVGWMIVRWLF